MDQVKEIMSRVIKPWGNNPVFNCMLAFKNGHDGNSFSAAIGHEDEACRAISCNDRFRIGSITKLFTLTVILQLREEGLLNLEDHYFDVIDRDTRKTLSGLLEFQGIDYSANISIMHLLQHQSGVRDYFSGDERFLQFVIEHPQQSWSWELVMEKYFGLGLNTQPAFTPGMGFLYSDTNYLLMGVLIEQVTGISLQQVYRQKISQPLGLSDTYLEFLELPEQVKAIVYPYYGMHSLRNVNTSFDWGGGGLVSGMNDLQIFIRSLFQGTLFKQNESLGVLEQLTIPHSAIDNFNGTTYSGSAIQKRKFNGYSFVGHNSSYASMLFYDAAKDISIVLTLNQAAAVVKAEWLMKKVIMECLY